MTSQALEEREAIAAAFEAAGDSHAARFVREQPRRDAARRGYKAQQSERGDREAIARIINPSAWGWHDRWLTEADAEKMAGRAASLRKDAHGHVAASLAQADAILALTPPSATTANSPVVGSPSGADQLREAAYPLTFNDASTLERRVSGLIALFRQEPGATKFGIHNAEQAAADLFLLLLNQRAATPASVPERSGMREALETVKKTATVGRYGTTPLRSKWVTISAAAYHQVCAALSTPKREVPGMEGSCRQTLYIAECSECVGTGCGPKEERCGVCAGRGVRPGAKWTADMAEALSTPGEPADGEVQS